MEAATVAIEASTQYVGRWNRLVSTTNWEKGRIISDWRQAMQDAGAPAAEFTDDAWSRQVGDVSPQHVGRLRRVFERFGGVHEQYSGLYWSHFHAALDWDDAEMYLEGAVQNTWSVPQMRNQRCEATGGAPDAEPQDMDVTATEVDEDFSPAEIGGLPTTISESFGEVHGAEGDYFDDETASEPRERETIESDMPRAAEAPAAAPVRPFAALPPLPADVNDAFELFKLAVLNHKVSGWREIARDDLLTVLDSLRQLALAPTE
ncbi:MAG: hypothetical protein LLG00_02660 [Planctomycetaceae bacterium]|nr:hypothetical protein [Planctomycetaceae bacterium]